MTSSEEVPHESGSRRGLRVLLTVIGVVACVAGTLSVVFGSYLQPGHGRVVPAVDSELRFYAVWYVFAGVILVRSAARVEEATFVVRAVGAAFFAAGCGRAISLVVVGKPHVFQLVLMVIEWLLPFVIIPWQAAVAHRPR